MARAKLPPKKKIEKDNKTYSIKQIFEKRTGRKMTTLSLSDSPDVNSVKIQNKIVDYNASNNTKLLKYYNQQIINIEKYANIKLFDKELAVNPEKLANTFGLVSVNFGRYVQEDRRVEMMFATAIALEQISKSFNIPRENVGMNKLSIGLGSSGVPKSLAVYIPSYDLININYITGKEYTALLSGSFFHEYSHFIDSKLGKLLKVAGGFLSGGKSTSKKIDPDFIQAGGIKSIIETIFQRLYWNNNKATTFQTYLKQSTPYYNERTEVLSRLSESWYTLKKLDKGKFNYLMTQRKSLYNDPIYPNDDLINKVDNLLDQYYNLAFKLLNGEKSATPPKNDAQKSPTKRVLRVKRPASPKKEKIAPEPKKVEKKESEGKRNIWKYYNIQRAKNLKEIEDNILKILYQFGNRVAGAIQVQEYLYIENRTLVRKWMDENNFKSNEDLKKHLAKKHSLARKGKGKERRKVLNTLKTEKQENAINEVFAIAKEEYDKSEKEIEEYTKKQSSPEPKKVVKKPTPKGKVIVGNSGILETPSQEITSKYVIMELDDVIQSHDERTFDWNPKYPKQCQERDYKKSAEKDKVLSYSSNFKPYHFINDSPEAMTGPSVVSKDNVVLGGNGRIMMLKRVKLLNNYDKYIDYLKPRLQMFGFSDNEEFKKIKYPVLVRMINAEMDRCSWYSRILNETLSRAKDQNTNSLSLAKSLSQKGFEEIAQIFEGEDDETFNQVVSKDKNQKVVIDVLRKNEIITSSNSPIWLTNDGNLTPAGKNNLENLLLAKILPSEELIEGAKDYTNRILKAIPVLTKIQTLSKEFDLLPYLRDVIKFENIRRTQGVSIKEFLNQESMFGNAEMPDNLVAMLWVSLKSGVNKFRDILESYYVSARNSTQGDSMFGYDQEVTPESILSTLVANRGLSDRIKLSTRVVDSDVIKKGNEVHGFTGKDCKYYYVAGSKFNNGSTSFLKTAMNNYSAYNRKHSDPQAKIYKFTNKNKANSKMRELLKNSGYFSNKSKNVQLTLANKPKRTYKKASGLSNKVVNHLKGAKQVATNKKLTFSQKLRKLLEY